MEAVMRNLFIASLALALFGAGDVLGKAVSFPGPRCAQSPSENEAVPRIQVAILLDTSNSMDGLIDQAKAQLWKITNAFVGARRGGRMARLEVALYEYGNARLSPQSGWIRRILPFTNDLDRLSEELFALTTRGGDEYCGAVLQSALDELAWTNAPGDLRVVFIAGNEPFTQGPVDYETACRRAKGRGVIVNTIHCGAREVGITTGWLNGAALAQGSFSVIDQGLKVVHVEAPQDAEIARLSAELNRTYIPYGAEGAAGQARQETQDRNAAAAGQGAALDRAVSKSNRFYSNHWDAVDSVRDGTLDLEAVSDAHLPAEMRPLSPAQRKAYVAAKQKERDRLQAEINRLNAERTQFLDRAGKTPKAQATLDQAMTQALAEQAACRGIALQ
jgi:hypothetical protein